MGRGARGVHPHANLPPGARLQRGLQPRRQAPRQRLLRQVCAHLEHAGQLLMPDWERARRAQPVFDTARVCFLVRRGL